MATQKNLPSLFLGGHYGLYRTGMQNMGNFSLFTTIPLYFPFFSFFVRRKPNHSGGYTYQLVRVKPELSKKKFSISVLIRIFSRIPDLFSLCMQILYLFLHKVPSIFYPLKKIHFLIGHEFCCSTLMQVFFLLGTVAGVLREVQREDLRAAQVRDWAGGARLRLLLRPVRTKGRGLAHPPTKTGKRPSNLEFSWVLLIFFAERCVVRTHLCCPGGGVNQTKELFNETLRFFATFVTNTGGEQCGPLALLSGCIMLWFNCNLGKFIPMKVYFSEINIDYFLYFRRRPLVLEKSLIYQRNI